MRRHVFSALLISAASLVPATIATAHGNGGHGGHGGSGSPSWRALAQVRWATAKYHWLGWAEADGFGDLNLCVPQMGEHWVKLADENGNGAPDTFEDGVLDRRHPEALVYAHKGSRLKLVAVEWVSTAPGNVPGIGDLHLNEALGVYVLHAWVWKHNPDGVLTDMNPRVGDCPV